MTLAQPEIHHRDGEEAEPSRNHRRQRKIRGVLVVAGKQPADRRAEHEADADGRAHRAQRLRPILGSADVGGIGERRRKIPRHEAGEHPRGQEPPQVLRKPQDHVRHERAGEARHENGPPAEAIAQPTPERRGDQLAERVRAEDRRDEAGGGAKPVRHVGHERNENAEAENVDDTDEEQGAHQ